MSGRQGILILYNQPTARTGYCESEAGVLAEVQAVVEACTRLQRSCRAQGVTTYGQVVDVLAGADEEVVFNLVEGFDQHPERAMYVPALCAALNKACTGTGTPGLLLSLDKWQSKAVLQAGGCRCPEAVLIPPGTKPSRKDLFDGPYLVKPLCADASEGIDRHSVVPCAGQRLNRTVTRIHERFGQPALVERYIDGRELNVSVLWRQGQAQVLPLAEIDFSDFGPDRARIVGYEAKWDTEAFEYHHTTRILPASLPQRVAARIRDLVVRACRALGCEDYCRVDLRLDGDLHPFVLEVNANPDISPDAGFAAALAAANIPFAEFVRLCLDNAVNRHHRPSPPVSLPRPDTQGNLHIRRCEARDRLGVLALLAGTHMFRPDEMTIAREVLDDALNQGPDGHYQSFVAERSGTVAGWVCFGPTACTLGTYDLYWIAVDVAAQGGGIGRQLMGFAESAMQARGAVRVVVETSAREAYEPSRRFYRHLGYLEAASVADFYGAGDDKVIFIKTLPS